jgi:hypothetical protein
MIFRMTARQGGTDASTAKEEVWAVAVADGSGYPVEVVAELGSFSAAPSRSEHRSFGTDVLANALGGLLTAGVWDALPLYAAYLLRHRRPSPASATDVARQALDTLAAAGVVRAAGDAAVTDLVKGPGEGWTGTVRVGGRAVAFVASSDGTVVAYRTIG